MLPYTPNSSSYILAWAIVSLISKLDPLWCFNIGRLLVCYFIYLVLPENAKKPFVAICSRLGVYFSYFDQTSCGLIQWWHRSLFPKCPLTINHFAFGKWDLEQVWSMIKAVRLYCVFVSAISILSLSWSILNKEQLKRDKFNTGHMYFF